MRVDALRDQIAVALRAAMKARDSVAMPALRGLLHAIDNTSAMDIAPSAHASSGEASDGAVTRSEMPRRLPSPTELRAIIESEATEREAAASVYDGIGESAKAAQLRAEALIVRGWLASAPD